MSAAQVWGVGGGARGGPELRRPPVGVEQGGSDGAGSSLVETTRTLVAGGEGDEMARVGRWVGCGDRSAVFTPDRQMDCRGREPVACARVGQLTVNVGGAAARSGWGDGAAACVSLQ